MLFASYMIIELSLFLKCFLAHSTSELLLDDFFDIASQFGLLFLFSIEFSKLLPVRPQFLRVLFSLYPTFLLLLAPTGISYSLIFGLVRLPTWVLIAHMIDQVFHLVIEFSAFSVASSIIVVFDKSLNSAIWSLSWVIDIDVGKLLGRGEALPVLVEAVDFLLGRIFIAKRSHVVMLDSYLLLVLLFFIKLSEELAIDSIEVQAVLALHKAGEHVALEEALELRLRDVAAVCLGHPLADVLTPQDLIPV